MDDDEYDEFGNYIGSPATAPTGGGAVATNEDDEDTFRTDYVQSVDGAYNQAPSTLGEDTMTIDESSNSMAVVLAEDKKVFPDANEVYPNVTTVTLETDAQDLETPLLAPQVNPDIYSKDFAKFAEIPSLTYDQRFMTALMNNQNLIRNITIMGQIHSGKTKLVHNLFQSSTVEGLSHDSLKSASKKGGKDKESERLFGTRQDEHARQISTKCTLTSLAAPDIQGKHYALHMIDTPGHVDFYEDALSCMCLSDGVVLVVDAVEGVMSMTEKCIADAVHCGQQLVLVINKIDRLMMELRLPPEDAYYKLAFIVDEVNDLIRAALPASNGDKNSNSNGGLDINAVQSGKGIPGLALPGSTSLTFKDYKLSPEKGNVVFASGEHHYAFTLQSYADLYLSLYRSQSSNGKAFPLMATDFVKRLWGDWYIAADAEPDSDSDSDATPTEEDGNDNNTTTPFIISKDRKKAQAARPEGDVKRTFVHFVLTPLYKIYSHVLADELDALLDMLNEADLADYTPDGSENGEGIRRAQLQNDSMSVLRLVLSRLFGSTASLVDAITKHVASPNSPRSTSKLERMYCGDRTRSVTSVGEKPPTRFDQMLACDPRGSLAVHVGKMLYFHNTQSLVCLARIYSGTLRCNQQVQLLGSEYTEQDTEDASIELVQGISLGLGPYTVPVGNTGVEGMLPSKPSESDLFTRVGAGNLVLLSGLENRVTKNASLFSISTADDTVLPTDEFHSEVTTTSYGDDDYSIGVYRLPDLQRRSCMSIAVEPLKPSELPRMVTALRSLSKVYSGIYTKVEDSGEHIISGTGEMLLDVAMHDLRRVYGDLEVKVSDPFPHIRETVVSSSSINCFASTANGKNRFTAIAEPLDEGLCVDISNGLLRDLKLQSKAENDQRIYNNSSADGGSKKTGKESEKEVDFIAKYLQQTYDWDLLASRSVWAFGPEQQPGNILLDDTLPSEVDKNTFLSAKNSVVQGFQWASREGPLCDEPLRNVKIKILDAQLHNQAIQRGGGQVIPAARRLVYSSFLLAQPRLMEPVYRVDISAPVDSLKAIAPVLSRRRGYITNEKAKAGAPFYTVQAYVPLLDSFGFETDLRSYTQGTVFAQLDFDHWATMPGDPLDENVILHPLEPSPPRALAKDIMTKIRRRKGLSDNLNGDKYYDDAMLMKIREMTTGDAIM